MTNLSVIALRSVEWFLILLPADDGAKSSFTKQSQLRFIVPWHHNYLHSWDRHADSPALGTGPMRPLCQE